MKETANIQQQIRENDGYNTRQADQLSPNNLNLLKQQITDQSYNLTVNRANIALELLDWVVSHQAVGERIATLSPIQQRMCQRYDKVGMLYLPSYVERLKNDRAV